MRLGSRVARLEKRAGAACPGCRPGGEESYEVTVPVGDRITGPPRVTVERPACPVCGRGAELRVLGGAQP